MKLTQLLYEDQFQIYFDEEENWLYVNWMDYQTVDSVKRGCEHMLQLMMKYETSRILNDNSKVLGTWDGAAHWGATDWFPRMKQSGLKKFAWVQSTNPFAQMSTEATLSLMRGYEAFGIRIFLSLKEAEDWLRENVAD